MHPNQFSVIIEETGPGVILWVHLWRHFALPLSVREPLAIKMTEVTCALTVRILHYRSYRCVKILSCF